MIRIHIPGFYSTDSGGPRWGDAQIIDDGTNYLVIDGYCGIGTTRLIKRLKMRQIRNPYLLITHAHWDHYCGIRKIIRDEWFKPKALYCQDPSSIGDVSGGVRSEKQTLRNIISEARGRGIPVKYLKDGDRVQLGEIDFFIYRKTEPYEGNNEAYLNDASLCCWFHTLGYWTSGDGPMKIYDLCRARGAKPKFFKIPHHGNNCPRLQAIGMKSLGAKYCWDNDYNTQITEFLRYGRNRCIQAGIRYFGCHGDLNVIFFGGLAVIYKDFKKYTYKCLYQGKTALRGANATIVRKTLRGTYGTANTRITKLIDAGYYPLAVQQNVDRVVEIAKGIKSGKLRYGTNEARIAKIDKELGKGYGQLVQDYINVLYGIRKEV